MCVLTFFGTLNIYYTCHVNSFTNMISVINIIYMTNNGQISHKNTLITICMFPLWGSKLVS